MLNAYSTILLVIFLLVLIVLIVSALTVRKKMKNNSIQYEEETRWRMNGRKESLF